ncbi:MAG: Ig-like domain-containing protein [Synergistaceae bacterium]|nr:Ig-like domain-containing protein [Synergistaceae bacterium]
MKRIFMAILLCFVVPGAAFADKAIVKSQIAPVLSEPGGSSAVRMDEVLFGMVVDVLDDKANPDYPRIRTAYGFEGYACADDLHMNDADAVEWEGNVNRRVSFPHADIHGNNGSGGNPSQGSNGRMFGWLPKGALIYATSSTLTADYYYPISMPSWVTFIEGPKESPGPGDYPGRFIRATSLYNNKPKAYNRRFEPSRLLKFSCLASGLSEKSIRNNLVADALSYCDYLDTIEKIADPDLKTLGTMAAQWRKGGKTHQGMDASGLVSMVYLLNDILISRDVTPSLAGPLRPIDFGKQAEGDVLFWDAPDGKGLYIGNDQFIYASYDDQKVRIGTIGVDLMRSDIIMGGTQFPVVSVTGLMVSPDTVSLQIGKTQSLSGTLSPADASYTAVTWSSSDPTVATISATGLVTGIAKGTLTITAKTADGDFTDSCKVTIDAMVSLPGGAKVELPTGTTVGEDGRITLPVDGTSTLTTPTGTTIDLPGRTLITPDGTATLPAGGMGTVTIPTGTTIVLPGEAVVKSDGTITLPSGGTGTVARSDATVKVEVTGSMKIDDAEGIIILIPDTTTGKVTITTVGGIKIVLSSGTLTEGGEIFSQSHSLSLSLSNGTVTKSAETSSQYLYILVETEDAEVTYADGSTKIVPEGSIIKVDSKGEITIDSGSGSEPSSDGGGCNAGMGVVGALIMGLAGALILFVALWTTRKGYERYER